MQLTQTLIWLHSWSYKRPEKQLLFSLYSIITTVYCSALSLLKVLCVFNMFKMCGKIFSVWALFVLFTDMDLFMWRFFLESCFLMWYNSCGVVSKFCWVLTGTEVSRTSHFGINKAHRPSPLCCDVCYRHQEATCPRVHISHLLIYCVFFIFFIHS